MLLGQLRMIQEETKAGLVGPDKDLRFRHSRYADRFCQVDLVRLGCRRRRNRLLCLNRGRLGRIGCRSEDRYRRGTVEMNEFWARMDGLHKPVDK